MKGISEGLTHKSSPHLPPTHGLAIRGGISRQPNNTRSIHLADVEVEIKNPGFNQNSMGPEKKRS